MTFKDAVQTILPGRYRHFKGNEYEVVGIARHSETEEPLVVYRALVLCQELAQNKMRKTHRDEVTA